MSWPTTAEWGFMEKRREWEGARDPSVLLAHASWSHIAREELGGPPKPQGAKVAFCHIRPKFKASRLRIQGGAGFSVLGAVSEAARV